MSSTGGVDCTCTRALVAEQLAAKLQQTLEETRRDARRASEDVAKALVHRAQVQQQTEELVAEFARERKALEVELEALRVVAASGSGGGGGGSPPTSPPPAAPASPAAGDLAEQLAASKTRASEADAKTRAVERQLKEERDASAKRAARVKALEEQLRAQGEEHQLVLARTAALGGELAKHTVTLAQLGEEKRALEERLQRLADTAAAPKADSSSHILYALLAVLCALLWALLSGKQQQRK